MRDQGNAFHLAVPARDLDDTQRFYVDGLGCKLARRYPDRITLDFFGDQLVCHLHTTAVPTDTLELYPRHFGITFRQQREYDDLVRLVDIRGLPVFAPVSQRFKGRVEEHSTFVLRDPTDNLIEFKHYLDPRMMY